MKPVQESIQSVGKNVKDQIRTSPHLASRSLLILFIIWAPFILLAGSSALGYLLQLITYHMHFLIGLAGGVGCWFILHNKYNPSRRRVELAIVLSAVLPILMLTISPILRPIALIAFCGTPYVASVHFLNESGAPEEPKKKKKAKDSDDEAEDDNEVKVEVKVEIKDENTEKKVVAETKIATEEEKFFDHFLLYSVSTSILFLISSGGEESVLNSIILGVCFGAATFVALHVLPIVKPKIPVQHVHDYPELLFVAIVIVLGNIFLIIANALVTPQSIYELQNPFWLSILLLVFGLGITVFGFLLQGKIVKIPALQDPKLKVLLHNIFSGAIFACYSFLCFLVLSGNWIVTQYLVSFVF